MPNWCTNKVSMLGLSKYYTVDEEGKPTFSFQSVIPMPESLNVESGSSNDYAIMVYLTEKLLVSYKQLPDESQEILRHVHNMFSNDWHREIWNRCQDLEQKQLDEYYEQGKVLVSNIKNYGCPTWYEWCRNVWGTKWDACDVKINGDEMSFDTAWCPPYGVLERLSELNPGCEVVCEWYEEGGYEGALKFINGECTLNEEALSEWEEEEDDPLDPLDEDTDFSSVDYDDCNPNEKYINVKQEPD